MNKTIQSMEEVRNGLQKLMKELLTLRLEFNELNSKYENILKENIELKFKLNQLKRKYE